MSAIIGAVVGAVVLGVLAPAGAKLVRIAAREISNRFNVDDVAQGDVTYGQTVETIKPVSTLRSEFKPIRTDIAFSSDMDEIKAETFGALASTPLYTSNEDALKKKMSVLERAKTLDDVREAARDLSGFVESDHQKVFGEAIRLAGERASSQMGFTQFTPLPNGISSGQIRFAATDVLGRTLVTEISVRVDGDVRIDTEVLGVSDDSCHRLLDEFHDALRREGVDISGPPKRESTGGICTSTAAKEYLASTIRVKRQTMIPAPTAGVKGKLKRLGRQQRRNRTDLTNTAS